MRANSGLPMENFQCRSTCQHRECQRHSHIGVVDPTQQSMCPTDSDASSIFLENVIDLANTLAQIMIICGIHECKAKQTVDVTTYAFLHYDQVCYCIDQKPKKRIRKEDVFHELGKKCLMNRVEAHLAYTIIKRGFKAFYYNPKEETAGEVVTSIPNPRNFSIECVYVHAAKKTAESFARYDGLSCTEQRGYEAKIKVQYKKFFDRMQTRLKRPENEDCNCCFCSKKRGHHVYAKPPCEPKKPLKHICPNCCKKQNKKFIHPSRAEPRCPVCKRVRKFCICAKYQFSLEWVKSIWERPDFSNYYKRTIEEEFDDEYECARVIAKRIEAMKPIVSQHSNFNIGSTRGSATGLIIIKPPEENK